MTRQIRINKIKEFVMKFKNRSQISLEISLIIALMFFYGRESLSTTQVVNVSDFQFSPANFTITVGDTVKWQWLSGTHTTTSLTIPGGAASWDAPMDFSHTTFIYRVTVAGTYNYHCTFHAPGMAGSFTANPIGIIRQEGEVPESFGLRQN